MKKSYLTAKQYKEVVDRVPIQCVDGVIMNEMGYYLLVKRKNHPLKGQYWVPGGRVQKGEKFDQAFKRKMKEELGVSVEILGVVGLCEDFYTDNEQGVDYTHTTSVVFLAVIEGEIKLDDQSESYVWANRLPDDFSRQLLYYNPKALVW